MCFSVLKNLAHQWSWPLMTISTHPWMKLTQHTHFPQKGHHSLLAFRHTRQNISTMLGMGVGGHFKQRNYPKSHKNVKLVRYTMKRTFVYSMRAKRQCLFVQPQLGTCTSGDKILFCSMCPCMTVIAPWVLISELQIHCSLICIFLFTTVKGYFIPLHLNSNDSLVLQWIF